MKLSYEKHFKSNRTDGRFTSSMAAYMQYLREYTPVLSLPKKLDKQTFEEWQKKVKEKAKELLLMPESENTCDPIKKSSVKRDTYTVEKWEFYPDKYSVVPVLILIPDIASKENPVPGVFCFPGSYHSKELLAGEPLIDRPACSFSRFPERNNMAQHMVKNGMVAFAFDNIATAECALDIEDKTDYGTYSREQLCYGYLQGGFTYHGISVFQKLCFLKFVLSLPYVDKDRLAVSAHSLGCTDALFMALICDEIKAVVFNDYVCSWKNEFVAVTEEDEKNMVQNRGNWHQIPGFFRYFDRPDLLGALAPKYLTMNEGGAERNTEKVFCAYAAAGASDRVFLSHYPKYKDEKMRSCHGDMPLCGLSEKEMQAFNYVDAPDHSFRAEPAIELLKKAFF